MQTFTILNTPKISISNEKFIYNYYIENESNLEDNKFILYDNESESYALNTRDAGQLIKPKYITFDIDLTEKNRYNRRSLEEYNANQFVNDPAVNIYFSLLESLGTSRDNLFTDHMRLRHFNDIHSLKEGQIHDRSFDLTSSEDVGEIYNQMILFLDEEDPSEIIRPNSNHNRFYVNFSKSNFYRNDTEDLNYGQYKQKFKNGTFSVVDSSMFDRIKNSNRKTYWTFLEDQQEESFFNKVTYDRESSDAIRPREEVEIDDLGAENYFLRDEIRSQASISNLFDNSPDLMVQTPDFDDSPVSLELNEYVVGVLIDKFELVSLENNNLSRQYKCSKFIRLSNDIETLTVTDEAINYGKSYIYETRPVLMQSYSSLEVGATRSYYLILGSRISSYGIKCIERESPEPPSYLELNYDLNQKGIRLRWCLPKNRQRDISNFQIFRRESPFEPFMLIKEIRSRNIQSLDGTLSNFENVDENIIESYDYFKCNYLDKDIQNNKTYIYAICCIDAHGLSSSYSAQVAGKYNSLTSRLDVDTISLAGALKQYPNQFLPRKTKFFNFENDVIANTPIVKNKSKMNIYFTPDYQNIINNNSSEQILNINDNEEEVENYFSVSLTNLNTIKTAKQNIYIQDRET